MVFYFRVVFYLYTVVNPQLGSGLGLGLGLGLGVGLGSWLVLRLGLDSVRDPLHPILR